MDSEPVVLEGTFQHFQHPWLTPGVLRAELGSNTSARDFLPRESTAQGADGLDGFGDTV